ncbi:MAG: DUF192 domain-containing protein [Alphaproteobacteria bacterium]|jgi:uncharacterized protein|nr:DUF192 domain-containing protein [Alphaproteobacteria bacterium]MBU2041349.1 DUF192 domain-containing protein [Alphaproteobacteria bacterium]MBU2125378.1 DUF192 domain-containing protein [Alphaproteobacteria bacterium]MBU2209540.1 DUF192 domain-containing protein [Alphaproteobacteria bacterium]MBU2290022.1 DUF192 domain-containing protein [Alphaproteobacteria bacterium]
MLVSFAAYAMVALSGLASADPGSSMEPDHLILGNKEYAVELALDNESRRQGLSGRSALPEGHAMVFVWPDSAPRRFHMGGMQFAIDIVFLDSDGAVLNVATEVPPCASDPCPRYYSEGPASVVVEIPAGAAAREGLTPGTLVSLPASWSAEAR